MIGVATDQQDALHANETLFSSLAHARAVLTEWRRDYNTIRPHGSLGNLPPAHYAKLSAPAPQRDGSLRAIGGDAPPPRRHAEPYTLK
jgi:putative transposase